MESRKAVEPGGISPSGTDQFQALITKISEEKGFAVTVLRNGVGNVHAGTYITFSLCDWQGKNPPRVNQVVVLEDVCLFEMGWRALSVTPVRLEAQQETGKGEGL